MEIIFLFRKEKSESLPILVGHRAKRPRNRRRNFCPYARKPQIVKKKSLREGDSSLGFAQIYV